MKLNRKEVFALIDGERTYQDSRWSPETTSSGGIHSPEEWILYMEDYLAEAKHWLSRESNNDCFERVMGNIRKVTAMGVAAMEQLGAPERHQPIKALAVEIPTVPVVGELMQFKVNVEQ